MFEAKFTTSSDGLTVTLTDQSTPPPGGSIPNTDVAWGDGGRGVVAHHGTASHSYATAGSYKITLTAHDGRGARAETSRTVTVSDTAPSPPPTPAPGPPPPDTGGGGTGGGIVGSSGNYTVVSQRRTVQQLATGSIVDVEAVGFQTIPSNAYCVVLVPLADWSKGNSATYINPVATAIETLIAGQPVSSASFTQDVDPATNLLADFMDFIVYYEPQGGIAPMTTTVRVSVAALAAGAAGQPTALIQAGYASLQHTAGL